jgi:hypothetical protein
MPNPCWRLVGLPEPLSAGRLAGPDVPQPKARAHLYVARATCAPGMPSLYQPGARRPLPKEPCSLGTQRWRLRSPTPSPSEKAPQQSQNVQARIPEWCRAEIPKLHAPIPKWCIAPKPKTARPHSGMVPYANAKNDKPGFEILRLAKGQNRTYASRNVALR